MKSRKDIFLTPTQITIKKVVDDYKSLFGQEYLAFMRGAREKKKAQKDVFGRAITKWGSSSELRIKGEWPETLNSMLKKRLTEEGWQYFITVKGRDWFIKEYPEFRLAEKI